MATSKFELTLDSFGALVLTTEDGQLHHGVSPVRAFPIQSPDQGISLVLGDGKEVAWVDALADLPPATHALLQDQLDGREFMPEIAHIASVSSFATPCTWFVKTDRGDTEFVLKDEGDIRRIGDAALLVADNHGIHYLVRNLFTIDKHSRKILDRFL